MKQIVKAQKELQYYSRESEMIPVPRNIPCFKQLKEQKTHNNKSK